MPPSRQLGPGQPQCAAAGLFTHKVRHELIDGQWDELLRLAGSVKRGWIVPSVLLTRMRADSRRDRLAKALREYGRLGRTNFVLEWSGDPDLRGRGQAQLNKGGSANALHRFGVATTRSQPPRGPLAGVSLARFGRMGRPPRSSAPPTPEE